MINKQRVLSEFFELAGVTCHTKDEREIGDLLTKRLEELGCTVKEDTAGQKIGGNCGNLIADYPGSIAGPTVMLAAHMDCVEPCAGIKPILKDGVIRSDGSTILGADDKAGVVAILETLRVIKEKNIPHGPIQVVFAVAEEGGVNGSKNMDKELLKADFGYALDSSGSPGKIVNAAPGQNKVNVKVYGKTAHAGLAPEKGINAIVAAGRIMANLPPGRVDDETTCNVGIIKGGTATNVVPDMVEIACETRSRNSAKMEKLTKEFCKVFEDGAAAQEGVRVEITVQKAYDPYVLPDDMPAIVLAAASAQKLGLPVSIGGTGGGSDANFYNTYGVPCAVLGVGMSNAHTKEEYITEKDLYDAAAWTLQIIMETPPGNKKQVI